MRKTKWEEIAAKIRSDIEQGILKPGDRLPAERDIMSIWKVSGMTAHRAMRELQRQGLVLRNRGRGTVVADNRHAASGYIAMILRYAYSNMENRFLRAIHDTLADQYNLIVTVSGDDPEKEAGQIREMASQAAGIILLPTCAPENSELIRNISNSGKPVIALDTIPENLEIDAVISDNYNDTLSALRYLTHKGHKRIAHFTERPVYLSSVRERYEAHIQVMTEAGVKDPSYLVRAFMPACDWEYLRQTVFDALGALLHRPEPPSAVFCLGEVYLSAILDVCAEMELSVPHDIEVLSYFEQPWMHGRRAYSVNRIVQRLDDMGKEAAGLLLRRLQGDDSPAQVIRIPADFYPAGTIMHSDVSAENMQSVTTNK